MHKTTTATGVRISDTASATTLVWIFFSIGISFITCTTTLTKNARIPTPASAYVIYCINISVFIIITLLFASDVIHQFPVSFSSPFHFRQVHDMPHTFHRSSGMHKTGYFQAACTCRGIQSTAL